MNRVMEEKKGRQGRASEGVSWVRGHQSNRTVFSDPNAGGTSEHSSAPHPGPGEQHGRMEEPNIWWQGVLILLF